MKIHHLRSATFVIESGEHFILVDPMLSGKGKLPPFAFLRHRMQWNPTVPLPANAAAILDKVTCCLLTHSQKLGLKALQHTDHLDDAGASFLRKRNIPVVTGEQDAPHLVAHGLNVTLATAYWQPAPFLGGTITAVPALHGHSWINRFMANGAGFHLQLPGEPSLYISGDTVLTADVERALAEFRPDIAVVACGGASLDVGGPILMTLDEVTAFIRKAPGKVIANHLEALNHCPTTRSALRRALQTHSLLSKTFIPDDGETIALGTNGL